MSKGKKLSAGMYSPYLSTMGGGERYFLAIAEALSHQYSVTVYANATVVDKARNFFGMSLNQITFADDGILRTRGVLHKRRLSRHDVFFYMTDGSVFFPPSPRNFLIIQSPAHMPHMTIATRMKLMRWKIICYSTFMQDVITHTIGKNSTILPPAITPSAYAAKHTQKKNIILSVGRFFPHPHTKKHDFLVKTFASVCKNEFNGWKLVIAGGLSEKGGEEVLNHLRDMSRGLPIEIYVNLPFDELVTLYKTAKLYWHAAGYDEDLIRDPERAEHFGITVLEAMAAGNIPIVYRGGGPLDIIEEGKNGFFYESPDELIAKSLHACSTKTLYESVARNAISRAQLFGEKEFYEKVETLLTA